MKLKIDQLVSEKNYAEISMRITLILIIASGMGDIFNSDNPTDP